MPARSTDAGKKTRKTKDPDSMDAFDSKKKKQQKVERGPTKKELRKEIQAEAEAKKAKRDSKKGKIDSEQTQEKKDRPSRAGEGKNSDKKSAGEGKKSGARRSKAEPDKAKKHRSAKSKTAKVLYTAENINSFLLEARNSGDKSRATNMLLFIFRAFRNNSADLLAKIKVLTSNKKVNAEGLSLHMSVMKHLFAFYDMKDGFFENLFKLIMSGSLLSRYVCDYLYSTPFEPEEYDEHFNRICSELARILEKTAQLPFEDYMEYVQDIDAMDDIQDFKLVDETEQSTKDTEEEDGKQNSLREAQKMLDPHDEDSTFTLQSLNDDDEIERLDRELGSFFSKGAVSAQDEEYAIALARCLEALIKHNYAVKIDDLIKVLYFYQFEPISNTFKHIVKEYMSKFREPVRVFKIFQMTCMVVPSIYSLYNVFLSHCNGDFDHLRFMRCVLNSGHEDFLLNRIDKDSFYIVYNSGLGEEFDDFMKNLVRLEHREDKLRELSEKPFKPEVKEAIKASLETLEKRKAKKAKSISGDRRLHSE